MKENNLFNFYFLSTENNLQQFTYKNCIVYQAKSKYKMSDDEEETQTKTI